MLAMREWSNTTRERIRVITIFIREKIISWQPTQWQTPRRQTDIEASFPDEQGHG
jgi:hypothetical protein